MKFKKTKVKCEQCKDGIYLVKETKKEIIYKCNKCPSDLIVYKGKAFTLENGSKIYCSESKDKMRGLR